MPVPGDLRQVQRRGTHHHGLRVARQQRLTGQMDRDERARTGRRDVHRGPVESEPERRPVGREVGVVADLDLLHGVPVGAAARLADVGGQIAVQGVEAVADARVHTDPLAGTGVPGVLQRVVAALQEQPLLRIGQGGLAAAHPEEPGVEAVDVVQQRTGSGEVRVPVEILGAGPQPRTPQSVKRRTCDTPDRMSCQYCSGVSAPGNLSAIPTTATRRSRIALPPSPAPCFPCFPSPPRSPARSSPPARSALPQHPDHEDQRDGRWRRRARRRRPTAP